MRTTTLQSSKASSSLWKLFAALLLVWILVPIGQASAQNKATESNGTEKTVIGGVDDLYGVDPSSEHCTDTKVGTNQTDGDKIVCLYNVGAKKFLSIGGLWGTQAALYNPQNEAFLHSRTSRAISQNETYRRNTPYPPLKNRPAYAGIHIL